MLRRPKTSRLQLNWHKFEQNEDGNWILCVQHKIHTRLFKRLYPEIMKKSNTGWRRSKSGKSFYMFLRGLTENDIKKLNRFITDFSKYVIINLNKHIVPFFDEELDFIIALDKNANSPEEIHEHNRTEIGEMIFDLKNRLGYLETAQIESYYTRLTDEISRLLHYYGALHVNQNPLLTSVPKSFKKGYDLPSMIIKRVLEKITGKFGFKSDSIVQAEISLDKPELKNLDKRTKIATWQQIYSADAVKLSCSVKDSDVYIIDDLYQSGTTIWSYAKFLKAQGARRVYGIACVKTLRDTDNQ